MIGKKDNSQNRNKNILNFRRPYIYVAAVIVVIICSAGFIQFSKSHTDKLADNKPVDYSQTNKPAGDKSMDYNQTNMPAAGNVPLEHRMIEPLARQYGYESWVILLATGVGFEVLLYNRSPKFDEDLNAKILLLDGLHKVRGQQAVKLSPELKGYSFGFKRGDFSQDKHLLAYRVRTDKAVRKKYSDLLVMDKNDLRNIKIIQTYEQKDVAQGDIPTIIDFSVDIVDDYVVYEDVDSYWKVQDVRTKEVYNSGDDTVELTKVEPCYMSSGIYLYVLKYIKDNSILAFNSDTKKFIVLNGTFSPDYEGYLLGISEKDNTMGLIINGKNVDVKLGQNTELLDAKGNKADIEDFYYYNWGKVWFDKKYSGKQFKSGEAVALKVIGIKNDAKDITGLGPYTGPADTQDHNPKYIYVPGGSGNPGETQKQTTAQPTGVISNITFEDQKQVEQLIKLYFNALEKNDYTSAWELTTSELKKNYPKPEVLKSHYGIETIRFISMKGYIPPSLSLSEGLKWDIPENTPIIWFYAQLDVKPASRSAWDEGMNERFVMVVKESDGKWRISGLATSPYIRD